VTGVAALLISEFPNIPIQHYAEGFTVREADGSTRETNLFELMVQTADRPPNPLDYFPAKNAAADIRYIDFVETEDGETTALVKQVFGRPQGFRENQGYRVDGFNPLFGYGRPNPMRAVLSQFSPSPYRDYITGSSMDPDHSDYGEL